MKWTRKSVRRKDRMDLKGDPKKNCRKSPLQVRQAAGGSGAFGGPC